MGYYPHIDYLGAAQGIVKQLDDAERIKMAQQESAQRAKEAESMAAYRGMQMRKMQTEMDQEDKLNSSLSSYYNKTRNDPDYQPSTTTRSFMDPTQDYVGDPNAFPNETTKEFTAPPKKSYASGLGEHLAASGLGSKAMEIMIKTQEAERKEKADAWKEYQKGATDILKSENPDQISNYYKTWVDNPLIGADIAKSGIKDISIDPKTKEMNFETEVTVPEGAINPVNGQPVKAGTYLQKEKMTRNGQKIVTSFVAVEEKTKDRFEPMGHGQMWDKVEKKVVKVPVTPVDQGLGGLVKEMALSREERMAKDQEEQRARQASKDKADAEEKTNKALKEDSNRIPSNVSPKDQRLTPEALKSINQQREFAGLPPLVEREKKFQERNRLTGNVEPLPEDSTWSYTPATSTSPTIPPGKGFGGVLSKPTVVAPPVRPAPPMPPQGAQVPPPPVPRGGGLSGAAAGPMTPPGAVKPPMVLTKDLAKDFLLKANGNRALAEDMARKAGYNF